MKKLLQSVSALFACAMVTGAAHADPGRGANTICYVWANNATPALNTPYIPSSTYSYNAAVRASGNSVTRTGTGTYSVKCKGVGGGAQWGAGGHVQVTAYGGGAAQCKVGNWATGVADFTVNVRCYIGTTLTNSQFDMLFTW
jgi:hypothetical protein